MKSSFCIDLQRFMLIPTKFPLSHNIIMITIKAGFQTRNPAFINFCYYFFMKVEVYTNL